MRKLNMPPFKHIAVYIFLVTLGSILIGAASLAIITTMLIMDERLNRMGISQYHLIIALGLIGFIVEVFLNKRRRKKEEVLLSTMTKEEHEKYKKESSERFEIRWWHEPVCYTICALLIEAILTLFNLN